jgi:hypothetical protein
VDADVIVATGAEDAPASRGFGVAVESPDFGEDSDDAREFDRV